MKNKKVLKVSDRSQKWKIILFSFFGIIALEIGLAILLRLNEIINLLQEIITKT